MSSSAYKVIRRVQQTFTIDLAAFANGDAMHTGAVEFAIALQDKKVGRVVGVCLTDLDKKNAPLSIHIFSQNPSTSTITANAVLGISNADLLNHLGSVALAAAEYELFNTNSECSKEVSIPVVSASKSLFVVLKSKGTADFDTATALTLQLFIEQD